MRKKNLKIESIAERISSKIPRIISEDNQEEIFKEVGCIIGETFLKILINIQE